MKHHLVFLHNTGVKRLNNKFWRNCITFIMNPSPNIQSVKKHFYTHILTNCIQQVLNWAFQARRHSEQALPSPLPITPSHLSFLFFSAPSSGKQLSSNFSDTQSNSSNYKWQPISVTNIIAQRQRLLSALIGGESLDLYVFRGWMANSYGRTSGNPELTLARWLARIVKLVFVGTAPQILHYDNCWDAPPHSLPLRTKHTLMLRDTSSVMFLGSLGISGLSPSYHRRPAEVDQTPADASTDAKNTQTILVIQSWAPKVH